MSSALAIAAVSAVLKDLLDNAMIDPSIAAAIPGSIKVTAVAPDVVESASDKSPQLNLFMYHVSPNQGWRNDRLPSRNGHGDRISNPPLALDLHYMLTAYASNDFQAEILLGYGMQLLHEMPVLTRAAINKALNPTIPGGGPTDLQLLLQKLAKADLADQIELVKITPEIMSTEEMSKLWAALNGHYRPTAAYRASVVLIEREAPVRSPLPVLMCGPQDRGVVVQASLIPPFPAIESITVRNPDPSEHAYPSGLLGETLDIEGHDLDGLSVRVRFTSTRLDSPIFIDIDADGNASMVSVSLPVSPPEVTAAWAPGIYSVAVLVQRLGEDYERSTNELPFLLAPRIVPPTTAARGDNTVTINLQCSPNVRPHQRVALVVDDFEIPAEPRAVPTAALVFIAKNLANGAYKVRLRVDGVDSRLIDLAQSPPAFDPSQILTVPS